MLRRLAIVSAFCAVFSVLIEPGLCASFRRNRRASNEETKCCRPQKFAWIINSREFLVNLTSENYQETGNKFWHSYFIGDGVRSYQSSSADSYGQLSIAESDHVTHVYYNEQDQCFVVVNVSSLATNEDDECLPYPLVSVEQINGTTFYIYRGFGEGDNNEIFSFEAYAYRDEKQDCIPHRFEQKVTYPDSGYFGTEINAVEVLEFGPDIARLLQFPPESEHCKQTDSI